MGYKETSNRYGPGWRGPNFFWQGRRRWALLELTGQLADLVRLRVPLGEGISAMALDAPDRKVRSLLFVLSLDLKNGLSLHEALARRPNFFPQFYVDAIRVGEETGRLGTVLERLEDGLLQTGRFQDELAGHLFYLKAILLSVVLVGTLAIVMLSSQFREIFSSFGAALPWTTQWLMRLHQPLSMVPGWVAPVWMVIPCILLLALVLVWIERTIPLLSLHRSRRSRLLWRIVLHVPWVGPLYRYRDLTHMAQQLETLTWAGLPLDKALDDVAVSDVSPVMSAALSRLGCAVRSGLSFDAALSREKKRLFPHMFRGLVQLGGQAGALSESLGQLAQLYQGETLNRARMLLNVGAPLGVCCVGAYVFLVCHSFYGVIFGLSAMVKP
jgi:type II secretory pathway component PulF